MSEEVKSIVNSPVIWAITVLMLGVVLSMAAVFLVKCIRASKSMGITQEQIKIAIKTSSVAAIGPSLAVMFGMVALLIVVGAPTALMRLSVIGNVGFEAFCAQLAAEAFNTLPLPENITPEIFQTTVFLCAVGCIGYMIIPAVFGSSFDKIMHKLGGNGSNMKRVSAISAAAILGCYSYALAPYAVELDPSTLAMVLGFVLMMIVTVIQQRTKKKWLLEWGLLIAMFGGMIITAVVCA